MNKNKRRLIFNIIYIVLFLLEFICIFIPQLKLKDLNSKFNLVNLTTGDIGDGYKMFKVSVPLVINVVLIIACLCFSVQRLIKKDIKNELIYYILFGFTGFLTAIFALVKKSLISFVDSLNSDMIAEATLLYGSYFMFVIGALIVVTAAIDIKMSHDEGKF